MCIVVSVVGTRCHHSTTTVSQCVDDLLNLCCTPCFRRHLVQAWCSTVIYPTQLPPVVASPHPLPVVVWPCPLPVATLLCLQPVVAWPHPLHVVAWSRPLHVVVWPHPPHLVLLIPTPSYPVQAWCRMTFRFLQLRRPLQLLCSPAVFRHSMVRSISNCSPYQYLVNIGFARCGCRWRTHHYNTQRFGLTSSHFCTLCVCLPAC